MSGKASLDIDILKQQLQARKMNLPARTTLILPHTLNPFNLDAFNRFLKTLQLKAYSQFTIKLYRIEFLKLLMLLKDRRVDYLETDHIKSYMLWLITKKGYGESQANTAINAIKFYFEKVLLQPRIVLDLPRPKKPILLAMVLGKRSISRIISATTNLKHRCLLMLAYAGGLRVSEINALKISDIDSERMCIHIKRAKGKKDRVVVLSEVLLTELRNIFCNTDPGKIFLRELVAELILFAVCSRFLKMQKRKRESDRQEGYTVYDIVTQPISLKQVRIFGSFRNYWGITVLPPHGDIHM